MVFEDGHQCSVGVVEVRVQQVAAGAGCRSVPTRLGDVTVLCLAYLDEHDLPTGTVGP